jgi:small subunit ribosomal protein S1
VSISEPMSENSNLQADPHTPSLPDSPDLSELTQSDGIAPEIKAQDIGSSPLEPTNKPKPVILKVLPAPSPKTTESVKVAEPPAKPKPVIGRVAPVAIPVPPKNTIVSGDTQAPSKVVLESPAKPKEQAQEQTRTKPVILSVTPAPVVEVEVDKEPEAPVVQKVQPEPAAVPKAEKIASDRRSATPKTFSSDDFAKALQAQSFQFVEGQIVNGRVAEHDTRGAYIDIGGKSPGFLPLDEAVLGGASLEEVLPIDTKRDFVIIREADADGSVTLSIKSFLMKQAWQNLRQFQSKNQSFNCKILDSNTGGLVVSAQGWRGFIPKSHLNAQVADIEQIRGTTLPVVVLELDEERSKIVLSNRLAVKSSAFSQLQKGQLVSGTVSSARPFGLFIDLGGMSGLLHVKEISQKYIGNVESVFAIGEQIKAVVLDIDESRQRIALSTKILELHSGEILENAAEVFAEAEIRLEKNISKLWDN